ncbi:MAG: tryptophan synthase subunit alpha [Kiritimatiellota bacterium]|nr:tryptophan synthase subunit alpha [Kiritimatiellota bacterium]
MNRITQTFQTLRRQDRKALIGYLTTGDPDLKTSERNIRTALANGLDILELGVPFSDPTADGPAIQAAGQRALASGTNLKQILAMAARLRRSFKTPMILFSYANPLFRYGYAALCRDAARAGIDGFLVVDLPFEESAELRAPMKRHGLLFIQLIAPTTSPERARRLLAAADGFVYYILVKGVTGARKRLVLSIKKNIDRLRTCTDLPIAAGFGINDGAQARVAARHADAVVVGSALVEAARAGRLAELIRELAAAVHGT